jgi:hypothetical protein
MPKFKHFRPLIKVQHCDLRWAATRHAARESKIRKLAAVCLESIQMHNRTRFKLNFGPYRTPTFRYGSNAQDEVRGDVTIVGLTDARIPWPIGKTTRAKSLVVYKGLTKAIRRESAQAVAYWWGVDPQTVSKWRRIVAAPRMTEGELRLRQAYGQSDWFKRAQQKAWAKARDPVRCAKIAAARQRKPRPPHVTEALRQANVGRPLSGETRHKTSLAHNRRGTRPPKAGKPWSAKEDALLRTLPTQEAVEPTGRTVYAVQMRRSFLRIPAPNLKPKRKRK